jgi:hypothetical protein
VFWKRRSRSFDNREYWIAGLSVTMGAGSAPCRSERPLALRFPARCRMRLASWASEGEIHGARSR